MRKSPNFLRAYFALVGSVGYYPVFVLFDDKAAGQWWDHGRGISGIGSSVFCHLSARRFLIVLSFRLLVTKPTAVVASCTKGLIQAHTRKARHLKHLRMRIVHRRGITS